MTNKVNFKIKIIPRPSGEEKFDENVVGVEYTHRPTPALNLDPQHGFGSGVNSAGVESAIELATMIPLTLIPLDPIFVTVRPDADSIGAMSIIILRMMGKQYDNNLIKIISRADAWGRHVLQDENEQLIFSFLSRIALDRNMDEKEKVARFMRILSGEEKIPEEELCRIKDEEQRILNNSKISVVNDKIIFIESTEYGALGLGYKFAPIVIALNPAMKSYTDTVTYKKYTIATSSNKYSKVFPKILYELNQIEKGWGGNLKSGIIGSPQGVSSKLAPEQVIKIVKKHVSNL